MDNIGGKLKIEINREVCKENNEMIVCIQTLILVVVCDLNNILTGSARMKTPLNTTLYCIVLIKIMFIVL